MKYFFALPALLRPALLLATASQHSFSVHDDLLAFPQYEVRFPEDYVLESEAQEFVRRTRRKSNDAGHETHEDTTQHVGHYQPSSTPGDSHDDEDSQTDSEGRRHRLEYEIMNHSGQKYLCAIPQIAKSTPIATEPPVNATLAKVEEQKELARATDRGWELLSSMEGNCVYYYAGWWTYRFCYGQGVKQFHQLAPARGIPPYPPQEDPTVYSFELGMYKGKKTEQRIVDDDEPQEETGLDIGTPPTKWTAGKRDLVQRGDSRYLVQRLDDGTKCDLTGKPRKIEIQFHCNAQNENMDRISMIKETATCTYLMVVQTSRLCQDVAFLPPKKDVANDISCRPVLTQTEVVAYEKELAEIRREEQQAMAWEATAKAAEELGSTDEAYVVPVEAQWVGDIIIGEHRVIPAGVTIEKSAIVGGGKDTFVETLLSSSARSDKDIDRARISDKEGLKKLREKTEEMADGRDWRIDVIDTPLGQRDFRVIILEDEEPATGKSEGDKKQTEKESAKKGEKEGSTEEKAKAPEMHEKAKIEKKKSPVRGGKGAEKKTEKAPKQETKKSDEEGSEEEYYKEEL